MTKEQQFLLELMSVAIGTKDAVPLPEQLDWRVLFREAHVQTVMPLCADALAPQWSKIPADLAEKATYVAQKVTACSAAVEFARCNLVAFLEEQQQQYVILKGEAAAAYYPKPGLRHLGDVDFMVPRECVEQTVEKLKAQGFTHSCEEDDYHQVLFRDGENLEIHIEPAGMPGDGKKEHIESFMETLYENRLRVETPSGAFYAPAHAHHGLILLLHMQHHMWGQGLGLRHIMDWACYVNQTAQCAFWTKQLLPLLDAVGLKFYCAVVTKMCSLYLGTACPSWASVAPEKLCRQLMEDSLAGGNFGRKDQDRRRSASMLPQEKQEEKYGKNRLLWKTLRQSAVNRHPKLEKRPVRRFLYMSLKVLRFGVLRLFGKRTSIIKAADCADRRRAIYEKLRIFETK